MKLHEILTILWPSNGGRVKIKETSNDIQQAKRLQTMHYNQQKLYTFIKL